MAFGKHFEFEKNLKNKLKTTLKVIIWHLCFTFFRHVWINLKLYLLWEELRIWDANKDLGKSTKLLDGYLLDVFFKYKPNAESF